MRQTGGIAVAALASLALAACGGGGDDSGGGGSATSADKVASTFKANTGLALTKLDDDEVWTMYVPGQSDSKALQRFGPFTIYVIKQDGGEESLLRGARKDADGFYWQQAGAGFWNLTRQYGANVYLVVPGLQSKKPDAHYRALDKALQGL